MGLGTESASAVVEEALSTWGSELFGPLLRREELLTTPLHSADGPLHLPDSPAGKDRALELQR
ncbi:hypothetical protein GCM10010470_46620 [Saccharopolyspora taberi]|uniref:Uncharacterized protein n=1 Tax=Saccharopolyspora taberi TaxID=60895 RepID=A0ABN3VJ57_9PSEU